MTNSIYLLSIHSSISKHFLLLYRNPVGQTHSTFMPSPKETQSAVGGQTFGESMHGSSKTHFLRQSPEFEFQIYLLFLFFITSALWSGIRSVSNEFYSVKIIHLISSSQFEQLLEERWWYLSTIHNFVLEYFQRKGNSKIIFSWYEYLMI